ncbi:hypothetical protein HY449_01565 [Candidatus Pacearchaeota archaeon]|nr:hypothetical protein [Candidatus Pacearchaeota archaeon]
MADEKKPSKLEKDLLEIGLGDAIANKSYFSRNKHNPIIRFAKYLGEKFSGLFKPYGYYN